MKVVLLEEANLNMFKHSVECVKEQYNGLGFPEFDEKFEEMYKCKVMYNREKGVLGFLWPNEADYSWFLIRSSK